MNIWDIMRATNMGAPALPAHENMLRGVPQVPQQGPAPGPAPTPRAAPQSAPAMSPWETIVSQAPQQQAEPGQGYNFLGRLGKGLSNIGLKETSTGNLITTNLGSAAGSDTSLKRLQYQMMRDAMEDKESARRFAQTMGLRQEAAARDIESSKRQERSLKIKEGEYLLKKLMGDMDKI